MMPQILLISRFITGNTYLEYRATVITAKNTLILNVT